MNLDDGFNADNLEHIFSKRRRPPPVIDDTRIPLSAPRSGIKKVEPNLWKLPAEGTTL